jgi:hypothetical protein
MSFDIDISQITPADVERKLYELSQDLDYLNEESIRLKDDAISKKKAMEDAQSQVRISLLSAKPKLSTQDKQDLAEERSQDLATEWHAAQLIYDACRQRMTVTREQMDLWRSIGASVRTSFTIQ